MRPRQLAQQQVLRIVRLQHDRVGESAGGSARAGGPRPLLRRQAAFASCSRRLRADGSEAGSYVLRVR